MVKDRIRIQKDLDKQWGKKEDLKDINLLKINAEKFLEKNTRFWNNWLGSHFAEEDVRVVVNH